MTALRARRSPEPIAIDGRLAAVTPAARQIAALLLAALLVGACASGPAGSSSAASASTTPSSASASAAPAPSVSDSGEAVAGNPGSGDSSVPAPPLSSGGAGGPIPSPTPTEVHPVAGLLAVHDVRATRVHAAMSGERLVAQVFWWSGPPPCSELSEVATARTGDTFTLTIREGAVQLGVACPALAMYKVTTVDLGPVAPGTYTVDVLGVDVGATVLYAG